MLKFGKGLLWALEFAFILHRLAVYLYLQLKMDAGHPKHVFANFLVKVIPVHICGDHIDLRLRTTLTLSDILWDLKSSINETLLLCRLIY